MHINIHQPLYITLYIQPKSVKMDIAMAPALGLYLDELYFTQYNIKQKRDRDQKLADLEVIKKRALSKQQQGQGQGQGLIHKHRQQQQDKGEDAVKTEDTNKSEATLPPTEGHNTTTATAGDGGVVQTTKPHSSTSTSADTDTKGSDTGGPEDCNTKNDKGEKEEVKVSKKVRIDDGGGFIASASTTTTAKVSEIDDEGHNSEGEKEDGEDEVGEAEGQVSVICSV